jgi:polyhydroxyalkanoate synthesis regulator phasin
MPQPKNSASSARKPAADAPRAGDPPDAGGREEQLLAALAALRDMLSKGVVITTDRLQETVDEAVRRGRMTRQDAEELVQNLYSIGRRQTQDALAELEELVERSAKQTRRQARARARDVSAAARRAPGTDRALRTVDRVRRAARLGPVFPIIGYDDLTAAQIKDRLEDLNPAELRKVRDHERRNANRKSVLTAIERRLR